MSAHQASLESARATTQSLNGILSPMAFHLPERLSRPMSWEEHIPFAFWLIENSMPRLLVELGTSSGNSYLAFCQAVKAIKLTTRCYAVNAWKEAAQTDSCAEEMYWTLFAHHDCRYGSFSRLVRTTFDEALDHFEDGSIDLLHIDGLHGYEALRHYFESWQPKLSTRAIVLIHGTNLREGSFGGSEFWGELAGAHPRNFQFTHCRGLGVLGLGVDLPAGVREFFALARNVEGERLIRDVYRRLGAHCSATIVQQQLPELLPRILSAARTSDIARRISLLAPRPVVYADSSEANWSLIESERVAGNRFVGDCNER